MVVCKALINRVGSEVGDSHDRLDGTWTLAGAQLCFQESRIGLWGVAACVIVTFCRG